jgi:hypothetical protein
MNPERPDPVTSDPIGLNARYGYPERYRLSQFRALEQYGVGDRAWTDLRA